MINVQTLWQTIRDITRKDHAGYTSTDEFNRALSWAQEMVFGYYAEETSNDQGISEALDVFISEASLSPASGQYYNLPADYKRRINAGVKIVENSSCGNGPTTSWKWANFWKSNEDLLTLDSPIRRPSVAKRIFAYEIIGSQIKWWPSDYTGNIYLKYYRQPVEAFRAFTLNTATQEEEYDSQNSVNLEWAPDEIPNFVDLILLNKGLAIRENVIVNWVLQKKSPNALPEKARDKTLRRL